MFKKILFTLTILLGLGFGSGVRAGDVALGTKVNTWPSFYPGESMVEAYMIVLPGGMPGLNNTLYINGAGTYVYSNIEFLGHYNSGTSGKKIVAYDWARGASHKVVGTDGNTYTCKRDHFPTLDNKPITGTNWSTYWELRGSGGGTWGTQTARYLDREGDDNRYRALYDITSNGLVPLTNYGYTPPSGNFMKTNHVIPGYAQTFNVVRFRNISKFLGTGYNDGRTMEKWTNVIGLWDFTQSTWVEVYSYQYWSDIDFNKQIAGTIANSPWIETFNPFSMTSPGPKVGFDDCKIIINGGTPYMLTPTDPRIGGAFTTFANNQSGTWTVDYKIDNYAWVVHYQK